MASYAHESITVSNTAVGLTAANIRKADELFRQQCKKVLITVESNPIRFTIDGTIPTTTVGHLLNPSDIYECDGADAFKFKAIRTGSDATIQCTYYV